jgi:hypothetical protein
MVESENHVVNPELVIEQKIDMMLERKVKTQHDEFLPIQDFSMNSESADSQR